MKDNNYAEGYAYVKGYDQFDGEVNLSGLTVTPGVGQFKSYDSNTGKVTIVDNNYDGTSAGAFMLIKEVPMFVQYQNGSDVLTASANLQVDGRAYVSNVVFGAISKDGTKREDGKLTVTELASNKYYIPLTTVEDQYGNTLDADDLNDQLDDNVLFVIPGTTGAFYTTARFGTVDGVTALWLASAADPKPGEMALTVTGASGKSFSTDVTVEDDPFIDTLAVTYPELYSEQAESGVLEFTAKDQYGNEVDLWDFAPSASGNKLTFTDKNHMTGVSTTITASGNAFFNVVAKDTVKKTFKVTVNASYLDPKTVVVFTTTTAGTKVGTASITVGEIGTAAKVKSTLKNANTQLDPDSATSYNFNANLQFEDANGNTMVRGIAENYPYFVQSVSVAKPLGSSVKASDLTQFAWTLSDTKPVENKGVTSVNSTGVISYGDFNAKKDYYIGLYGTPNGGTDWYLLNTASFHMTAVVGADKSYAITGGTMYTNAVENVGTTASVGASVKVVATTENNETYTVKASRISLAADDKFDRSNNKLTPSAASVFYLEKDSTVDVPVTVYVDGEDRDTINMKLTNKVPVASSVVYNHASTTVGSTLANISRVGAAVSGGMYSEDFVTNPGATLVFTGGELTLTKATSLEDTVTGAIKDQYGQVMPDTELFINGSRAADGQTLYAGTRYTIQYVNQNKSQKFVITPSTDINCVVNLTGNGSSYQVATASELRKALAAAKKDELTNVITLTAPISATEDIVIEAEDILDTAGFALTLRSLNVTVNGGLVTRDAAELADTNANIEIAKGGFLQVGNGGTAGAINGTITNKGTIYVNNKTADWTLSGTLDNQGTITTMKYVDTAADYAVKDHTATDAQATQVAISGAFTNSGSIVGNGGDTWKLSNATATTNGTQLEDFIDGLTAGTLIAPKASNVVLGAATTPSSDLVIPENVKLEDNTGVLTIPANTTIYNNGELEIGNAAAAIANAATTSFVSGDGAVWTIGATTAAPADWFDGILTGSIEGALTINVNGATVSTKALTISEDTVIKTNANLTLAGATVNNGEIVASGDIILAVNSSVVNNGTISLTGKDLKAAGASVTSFTNSAGAYIESNDDIDLTNVTKANLAGTIVCNNLTGATETNLTGDTTVDTLTTGGTKLTVSAGNHRWNGYTAGTADEIAGGTVTVSGTYTEGTKLTISGGTLEFVTGANTAVALTAAKTIVAGGTLDLTNCDVTTASEIGISGSGNTIILSDKMANNETVLIVTSEANASATVSGSGLAAAEYTNASAGKKLTFTYTAASKTWAAGAAWA